MAKRFPEHIIRKIRMEVLSGKSKYQVSRELDDNEYAVYNHTYDISNTNKKVPTIRKNELFLGKKTITKRSENTGYYFWYPLRDWGSLGGILHSEYFFYSVVSHSWKNLEVFNKVMSPIFCFFIGMKKNHVIPILFIYFPSEIIVEMFWSADFKIDTKVIEIKIWCPYPWSFMFIPDKYRLFIRPFDP